MSDYDPRRPPDVVAPVAVVDEEENTQPPGESAKVGERELPEGVVVPSTSTPVVEKWMVGSGGPDLFELLQMPAVMFLNHEAPVVENVDDTLPPEVAVTGGVVDAVASTGGNEAEADHSDHDCTTVTASQSTSTSNYEEEAEKHRQDCANNVCQPPAAALSPVEVDPINLASIGMHLLLNYGNRFYQSNQSRMIQENWVEYLCQPDTLQRDKDHHIAGLCQSAMESGKYKENPEVFEKLIKQLKLETPETIQQRILMAQIDKFLKNLTITSIEQGAQMLEMQPQENGGQGVMMAMEGEKNSTGNRANQQGSAENYTPAQNNIMPLITDEQRGEIINAPNEPPPTGLDVPGPTQACKNLPKRRSLKKTTKGSSTSFKKPRMNNKQQKVLNIQLFAKVITNMNKKKERREKIKAAGRILLHVFFSRKQIGEGTVSGKKSKYNPDKITYDDAKVDEMSRFIQCLLTNPDVSFENFLAYQQNMSIGLGGSDWDDFFQDVMVDYTNECRIEYRKKTENSKKS